MTYNGWCAIKPNQTNLFALHTRHRNYPEIYLDGYVKKKEP